jgi:hypothetical protein
MCDGELLLGTRVRIDSCPEGGRAIRRAAAHGFDTIVIEKAFRAFDGAAAATDASFRDRGIKLA